MKRNDGNTPCERSRELLARRLDETLERSDEFFLREHLESCAACRSVQSWIGQVDALSARAPLPEASEARLAEIEAAVMDEVRSPKPAHVPRRASRQARRPRRQWLVPSAAAAAVIAFLSWWQLGHGPDPLAPPVPAARERQLALREKLELPESSLEEVEARALRKEPPSEEAEADALNNEPALKEAEAGGLRGKLASDAAKSQDDRLADTGLKSKPAEQLAAGDRPKNEGELGDSFADAEAGRDSDLDVATGRGALDALEAVDGLATPASEPAPAAALAQRAQTEAETPLTLRLALRQAETLPSEENLAQLLDLWERPAAGEAVKDLRPRSSAANEAKRSLARLDESAGKLDADLSPSLEDSLRSFLASIADEEAPASLRARILAALEELTRQRE
jgi:hypothetical protein